MASIFQRAIIIFSLLLFSISILHADNSLGGAGATDYLEASLTDLCGQIQNLIPITAMLLVVTAGVVYSAGQFFGAETRARANVWATSCLTGAILGIIIAVVAPCILGQLAGTGTCLTCSAGP